MSCIWGACVLNTYFPNELEPEHPSLKGNVVHLPKVSPMTTPACTNSFQTVGNVCFDERLQSTHQERILVRSRRQETDSDFSSIAPRNNDGDAYQRYEPF
jgi:hypothetical protein